MLEHGRIGKAKRWDTERSSCNSWRRAKDETGTGTASKVSDPFSRVEHASGEMQEQYVGSSKNSIHSVDEAGDSDWWARSDGSQREEDLCMV